MTTSQKNNTELPLFSSLSPLTRLSSHQPVPLPTCQPIVFVSDRARANKEIEHDGILGERKKPKVICTLQGAMRVMPLLLNPKADTAAMWQIPKCDLCPVVISGEWRLWNAILTGSSNISGNKTIQHKAGWPKGAEQHLFSKWMQAKLFMPVPDVPLSSAIFSQYIQGQSFAKCNVKLWEIEEEYRNNAYTITSLFIFENWLWEQSQ